MITIIISVVALIIIFMIMGVDEIEGYLGAILCGIALGFIIALWIPRGYTEEIKEYDIVCDSIHNILLVDNNEYRYFIYDNDSNLIQKGINIYTCDVKYNREPKIIEHITKANPSFSSFGFFIPRDHYELILPENYSITVSYTNCGCNNCD